MRASISWTSRDAALGLALTAAMSIGCGPAMAQEAAADPLPPSVCETDPRYSQFDFWVGEWSVHGPDGRFAGTNDITKEEYGCLIRERWTDGRGVTGTSINYFNPVSGKWRQVWTSRGFTIDYEGGLDAEGAMALEGEITYLRDETTKPFRGRWIPREDGTVNQVFHEYDAGSGEWQEWFNAVYSPRKADTPEAGGTDQPF